MHVHYIILRCIVRLKRDGTRAETRFRLSPKRTSPFKSAGASVQSTVGSRDVRISVSNAGYTTFRDSVKSTGYPLHLPVSPSLRTENLLNSATMTGRATWRTERPIWKETSTVYKDDVKHQMVIFSKMHSWFLYFTHLFKVKSRVKVTSWHSYAGTEGRWRYSSIPFATSVGFI